MMTFYQELQLNQAGSKNLLKSCNSKKEKRRHLGVYFFKVLLCTAFCSGFVAGFSVLFGSANGVAGVGVLLAMLAFRQVDLGFKPGQSTAVLMGLFGILAIGPHLANQLPPAGAFVVNGVCIFMLLIFGCHNIILFNHATFVLAYLLLLGNDVYGQEYTMRVMGLLLGGAVTTCILYWKHRNREYKRSFLDVLREFRLESTRSSWQLKMTLGISLSLFLGQLAGFPRTMWIGIAVMSVLQPFSQDRKFRMKYRFLGNVAGCLCFCILIRLLPESAYGWIGIIGGILVGFSATYQWQTVFNAFGALAMAMSLFDVGGSIALRIAGNAVGVLFVLVFCPVFDWILKRMCGGNRKDGLPAGAL